MRLVLHRSASVPELSNFGTKQPSQPLTGGENSLDLLNVWHSLQSLELRDFDVGGKTLHTAGRATLAKGTSYGVPCPCHPCVMPTAFILCLWGLHSLLLSNALGMRHCVRRPSDPLSLMTRHAARHADASESAPTRTVTAVLYLNKRLAPGLRRRNSVCTTTAKVNPAKCSPS